MRITAQVLTNWLESANAKIQEKKDYLTELDQAIGDGDHGVNMARGFQEVQRKLQETPFDDIGKLFALVGNTLISKVGGASGPVYGIAFVKASAKLAGKKEISERELFEILRVSVDAIRAIGKSDAGQKTLLDVWMPLSTYPERFAGPVNWQHAIAFAREQVERTKDMVAKKGRASFLGERSVGHYDPGAMSSYYLFEALFQTLSQGQEAV